MSVLFFLLFLSHNVICFSIYLRDFLKFPKPCNNVENQNVINQVPTPIETGNFKCLPTAPLHITLGVYLFLLLSFIGTETYFRSIANAHLPFGSI